jgi:lipoyl(octanoyl) transferase
MNGAIEAMADAPDAVDATVAVSRLGLRDYAPVRDAMIAFTSTRDESTPDAVWLVEHPSVYTLGQAGRIAHLHGPVAIPVVHTERGGQITYHGPGQIVAYVLVDLRRRGIKVREFVQTIEAAVIDTLAAYNLRGFARTGAPGVYVDHEGDVHKISALGLKIVNGRSFHGVSLNVAMDLAPYDAIDACGYPGLKSIDLAALGVTATPDEVGGRLVVALVDRLDARSARSVSSR